MKEKGVEFKGGSHHGNFGGSENHPALLLLLLRKTVPRGSRDGFDGFGGFGGLGRDVYPP